MGGKGDAVPGSVEEPSAQIVLQRFDLKRNGRLSEEKMLGGFTKTELFGDCTEYLQAEILQLGHGEDYLRVGRFMPGSLV